MVIKEVSLLNTKTISALINNKTYRINNIHNKINIHKIHKYNNSNENTIHKISKITIKLKDTRIKVINYISNSKLVMDNLNNNKITETKR